jgi:hypothetical protein
MPTGIYRTLAAHLGGPNPVTVRELEPANFSRRERCDARTLTDDNTKGITMGDQQRWFKLWASAPSDDGLQALTPALRWAWAVLGIYTKVHGERGCVTVSPHNAALAAEMGIPLSDLIPTIARFPHVLLSGEPISWPHGHGKPSRGAVEFLRGGSMELLGVSDRGESGCAIALRRGEGVLEEWCTRHGGIIVTWLNWYKYQVDSTAAERARTSRSKRRGEENKKENKKKRMREAHASARSAPPPALLQNSLNGRKPAFVIDPTILAALARAPQLGAVKRLHAPAFWQAEFRANPGVDWCGEILRAEAYLTAHPERRYKRLAGFFHSWLGRADRAER